MNVFYTHITDIGVESVPKFDEKKLIGNNTKFTGEESMGEFVRPVFKIKIIPLHVDSL